MYAAAGRAPEEESCSDHLAAGVAAAGAVMALALLPAQPTTTGDDTPELRAQGSPATAAARG